MIHQYRFRDRPIVMDVESGAVHLVTPIVYDLLEACGEQGYPPDPESIRRLGRLYSPADIQQALDEIDGLIREGMLFSDASPLAQEAVEQRQPVVKAMCLHVAHDCNMACRYCFAGQGHFSGPRSLMTPETGRRAIDFLIAHSGNRMNLEIDFFGGEPLLNFSTVKDIVAYGREAGEAGGKTLRFTLTTNGLLLDDEIGRYLNEHMVNVVLSLDGRPETHDRMRPSLNGRGTWQTVKDRSLRFTGTRKGLYYVRGTFTRHNLDFAEDVRCLTALGFRNISIEPVVAPASEDYALREADCDRILEEYDKLADLWLEARQAGRSFDFFHFKMDLEQGPCVFKRVAGCGAGTEYVAVSPEGDIYPCHQFVGEPAFRLGCLTEPEFRNLLFDRFNQAHIFNKSSCRSCFAKYYCSGGCHANAWHANGDLLKPYELGCALERKRVECAIGLAAMMQDGN